MLREPIQSIVSFPFYRQVPQKSFAAASGYIAYLGLLFAAAVVLAIFVHLHPKIDAAADWAAAALPRIVLDNGKLSSVPPGPREVRHPEIAELAIVIDVDRPEPVTAQELADRKVMVYLNQNAVYVYDGRRLQTYDLAPAKGGKRLEVDEKFYRAFARAAKIVLYPVGFVTAWAVFFFWKHASAGIYSLLAFLLNALMDSGLEFPALYKLAVYAQTPVIALQIVSLFLPRIPYFGILALLVVGVYLWQAIRLIVTPPDPAAPLPLDA